MVRTTGFIAAVSCCFVVLAGTSSYAGILTTASGALTQGTVAFDNGNLQGNLDYAVFPAADFLANFAGLGYVPADAYVYTYQILNSSDAGTDSISADVVAPATPAHTIGTFNIGDVNASSAVFVGPTANWVFNPEIPAAMSSWGLAYSSPNLPTTGGSLIVDGGSSVLAEVPVPIIPEPASMALLGFGGGVTLLLRRRTR